MASVHAPGDMPAHNTAAGNRPGSIALPPNLTREGVQQAWLRYQTLQKEKVPADNPEMVQLKRTLTAIQMYQQQQKKRMEYQRQVAMQTQAQQDQQQQNGTASAAPTNGVLAPAPAVPDGHTSAAPAAPASTATSTTPVKPTSQSQPGTEGATAPGGQPFAFTPQSMNMLRSQINAFKFLAKNMPVPTPLQQQIFPSQQTKAADSAPDSIATAAKILDQASAPAGSTSVDEETHERKFKTMVNPYSLMSKDLNYLGHGLRKNRKIIPAIMPFGVNAERMREERDYIVYNRLMVEKAELENLSATIDQVDTQNNDPSMPDGALKRRTLLKLMKIRLLPKQRAMRQQISRTMVESDNLHMTANRANFRRNKKVTVREARITEKLEKQQRDARESKKRNEQTEFINSVLKHGEEVRKHGIDNKARIQKLGRLMLTTHQNIEKEEQKRVERTAKQRLQALKANDEETYLKLLGQAKDSRISHLLKQTDGFLKQLTNSVKAQQRGLAARYGDREAPEDSDTDEEDENENSAKQVDYYETAHRIKEEVTQQSSNLVGGTLKEYQIKGLQWMISLYNNNLNGILADEMGLGKTIQTISLITYLIEKKKQPGPYLVVVPLSTLTNWNNEFEKWAPSVKRIVYKGPPNARKQHQQQIRWGNFQVLLTTYEFIIKDRPILSKVKWLHMIVDEGHRMKNSQSKLSSTITQYYTTRYRLILTGTPLQNNLPELWALLNFVLPTIFKSVKSFDEWFNTPFANTGGQDKMELTEEEQLLVIKRLHKVLRPFLLRRLKKDVEKDLPDKQERVIKCNFSAVQAKLYKQLVAHGKIAVSDGKGGKTGMRGLSNMLMQLRKLCNHPFVFDEVEEALNPGKGTNDLLWRTAGKFELLDRVLPKFHRTGHRVLMFFQMTAIMNIMEDFMRLRGFQYLRLDGSTKADERSELLKVFNAPNSPYFCFLLSTRAGGLGLNLQTADTVIIYDSDWNPHQDLQAQDRAHRIGQKNEVRILRLITSNSVEEKILERANYKLDMDGKVIQAGKFDNKSTNEERDAMLRVMLESAEAAENLEQDEMDDDDLNMIMARGDGELELFAQMDKERQRNDPYGPDKKLPRLLTEAELPEIYMNDDNPVVETIEENYGRGARERARVKYDDGLTEEQWLEAVDNDDDTIEAAIARKEAKQDKRATNKEKKLRVDYNLGPSPAPSRESTASPAPKKRGRKPKQPEKRKADEASLDGDSSAPRKRGRASRIIETLSPERRELIQTILNNTYEALNDLEEPSDDPRVMPRGIIDPFIELPDKKMYFDYYQVIHNPICMKQIENKINRKEYQSLREFRKDIGLLCNNCRTYNEDTSVLFQDANLIERTVLDKLREETADHPDMADFETGPSGQLSGPVSNMGTPMR